MTTSADDASNRSQRCAGIDYGTLGELRDSSDLLGNGPALRNRIDEDGYLLMRNLLSREEVLAARIEVTARLARSGHLLPGTDPMDGYAPTESEAAHSTQNPGSDRDQAALDRHGAWKAPDAAQDALKVRFMPDVLAQNNPALDRVLYHGPMIRFFEQFFGESVRHFDFTWFRSMFPGAVGTKPHCDVVFMGRGERERLCTAWTPIGDIDREQGGLVILEGSNNHVGLRQGYCTGDVDAVCGNAAESRDRSVGEKYGRGTLTESVAEARALVGGRWLTTEYRAGDVLIFTVYTVHASIDNRSNRVRLSSDSRYQPASRPADERWVGANPVGHGPGARRKLIC